jgi:hypothetical protein
VTAHHFHDHHLHTDLPEQTRETVSRARRLVTAGLTGAATLLLTAAPAMADNYPLDRQEGADPGKGLSPAQTILLFVVIPIGAAIVIGLIAWAPGALGSNRYRPAKGWSAAPVWFAGPPDPVVAVQSAEVGDVVRGGASGNW